LKPVEAERLARALDKLERRRDEPSRGDMAEALLRLATSLRAAPAPFLDRVPFRTRDGVQFVEIRRVTHVIARDRLTHAVTATGAHVVDYGLADLEAKLDPAKFVRIHRATLLNLDFVRRFSHGRRPLLERLRHQRHPRVPAPVGLRTPRM
jgi:two-component system LytT family response regulator